MDTTTTTTTVTTASKRKRSNKPSKKPRIRTDTYWVKDIKDIASFFQDIYSGVSTTYYLDQKALTKLDGNGTSQCCWRVYSHNTNKPADSLLSTTSYRVAYTWGVVLRPEIWGTDISKEELRASLERVKTKTRDHTCHRCGIDWCCNPSHLRIDSRAENEADKHYHYFLNSTESQVGERFREAFSDLMLKRGVW